MADLSHWDFAIDFTGKESASLISGIDPTQSGFEIEKVAPVLSRLECGYELASSHYRDFYLQGANGDPHVNLPKDALESSGMRRKVEQAMDHEGKLQFAGWLSDDASDFERQRFSRTQLADWLGALGLASVYSFKLPLPIIKSSPLDKLLDTRERNILLIIIAVLCKEAKLDYTTSSKTADLIESKATDLGISISKNAIRDHLKKIPMVLGARTK